MSLPYPSSLPAPLIDGYSLTAGADTLRTDMESGAARVRRRSFSTPDRVQLGWVFDAQQFAIFRAWWDGEIGGGGSWFTMIVDDGVLGYATPRDVRFTKQFEAVKKSSGLWQIRVESEIRRQRLSSFDHLNLFGLPSLDLDFAGTQSLVPVTTSARQPVPTVTFTRASTATYINAAGTIVSAATNIPRFDYDPVTLVCKGLLIEESRTNLLLNSLLDGTSLSTQSVTVSATAYTLSFYGTGTVTLSGAYSGSLVGGGLYPTRSTLTFTPSAGSLTLTVSGSVKFANLEAGSFATSFMPTAGAAFTRSPDVATMTGVNFSSWYRQGEGTFVADFGSAYGSSGGQSTTRVAVVGDGTNSNRQIMYGASFTTSAGGVVDGSASVSGASPIAYKRRAYAYKVNDLACCVEAQVVVDATFTMPPVMTSIVLGNNNPAASTTYLNGHIARLSYYPKRLTNAQLLALTA